MQKLSMLKIFFKKNLTEASGDDSNALVWFLGTKCGTIYIMVLHDESIMLEQSNSSVREMLIHLMTREGVKQQPELGRPSKSPI